MAKNGNIFNRFAYSQSAGNKINIKFWEVLITINWPELVHINLCKIKNNIENNFLAN